MYSVYIIGPKDGPYKVGIAKDVSARLKEFQCGHYECLFDHFVYGPLSQHQARLLETYVHCYLRRFRLRQEWFDASVGIFTKAVKLCALLLPSTVKVRREYRIERRDYLKPYVLGNCIWVES